MRDRKRITWRRRKRRTMGSVELENVRHYEEVEKRYVLEKATSDKKTDDDGIKLICVLLIILYSNPTVLAIPSRSSLHRLNQRLSCFAFHLASINVLVLQPYNATAPIIPQAHPYFYFFLDIFSTSPSTSPKCLHQLHRLGLTSSLHLA